MILNINHLIKSEILFKNQTFFASIQLFFTVYDFSKIKAVFRFIILKMSQIVSGIKSQIFGLRLVSYCDSC